jgi:Condensation domain
LTGLGGTAPEGTGTGAGMAEPRGVVAVAPQSYQQEWMAAGKLRHPNPGWNVLLFWRFTGPLDHGALLAALGEVVHRHEVLRTTHAVRDGEAVQVVHRPRRLEIGTSDLRRQSATLRATELDRLARAQHGLALDHARGPLLCGQLVRAGDRDTYLLLTVDHAVCDGWSIGVLRSELAAAYAGAVTRRNVRLPELPLQYRDFATAQRAAAAAGEYDGQLDWWAGRLDPGALGLAAAVPRDVPGYTGVRYRLVVPAAVTDRLRRLRTTMFLTLLTALSGALAQRTPTGDVAVASMVAARRRPEHQRLVGMFANPVVVRTRVPAGGTFAQLLDRTRAGVVAAGTRQEAPWPLVAGRAGVGAAEIWLNVAPPPSRARFPGVAVDANALPQDYETDVPAAAWRGEMLVCTVVDSGPGADVLVLIDYNARQLTATTVAGLAVDVADLLAAAAADPRAPLPPLGSRPPLTS